MSFTTSKLRKGIKAILRDITSVDDVDSIITDGVPFPDLNQDPHTFAKAYLAYNIARKLPCIPGIPPEERKAAALRSLLDSEENSRLTNERLWYPPLRKGCNSEGVISTARRLIRAALSKYKPYDFIHHCRFSSGASTRVKRKKGVAYYKFAGKPHVTASALPYLLTAIKLSPPWRNAVVERYGNIPTSWCKVVPGNRIATVGKTAKIDRTIAIEPEGNMYLQLGVGGLFREALRSVGIDLRDQGRNQSLCWLGDKIATEDTENASNSVTVAIVDRLFDPEWADLLFNLRSHRGEMPGGEWIEYEMISSMGNGYTFELETFIFWALAKAASIHNGGTGFVSVYGDDVICAADDIIAVREVYSYCGFKSNETKSFSEGPFRESCGIHVHSGTDVSPFCLTTEDPDCGYELAHLANSWYLWCKRMGYDGRKTLSYLTTLVPEHLRNPVPSSFSTKSGLYYLQPEFFWHRKWQCYASRVTHWTWFEHRAKGKKNILGYLSHIHTQRETFNADYQVRRWRAECLLGSPVKTSPAPAFSLVDTSTDGEWRSSVTVVPSHGW